MTLRREKILWFVAAAILILLFLLSSTNLIIKEQERQVYRIAVVVEDSNDDSYVNFLKGMERAALEYSADVSFITLYDAGDVSQQINLIAREQQDGVAAVIVTPADDSALVEALEENRIKPPLILLHSDLGHEQVQMNLMENYSQQANLLSEAVMKNHDIDTTIYLLSRKNQTTAQEQLEDVLREILEQAGYAVVPYTPKQTTALHSLITQIISRQEGQAVLVALDTESLEEVSEVLAESQTDKSRIAGLYGMGSTLSILNDIDAGVIQGVCVADEFLRGYLSVQKAVEILQNKEIGREQIELPYYYIDQEHMREEQYEKMLFPIE